MSNQKHKILTDKIYEALKDHEPNFIARALIVHFTEKVLPTFPESEIDDLIKELNEYYLGVKDEGGESSQDDSNLLRRDFN